MNKLILELANEANKEIGYTFKLEDANQVHELMEKFAKLIVAHATECVRDVLRDENSDLGYDAASQVQERIKEHFGVD